MSNMQILIVTANQSSIFKELSQSQLDKITVTGIDSLNFIGFSRFGKIIIDCSGIHTSLHKLSLGIHDDMITSALWHLLSSHNTSELLFLVDSPTVRPSQDMTNLGVSFITRAELKKLDAGAEDTTINRFSNSRDRSPSDELLTADDIRALHQQGKNVIPAGSRMTTWAAEVADSLNFRTFEAHRVNLILPLNIKSQKDFSALREEIFTKAGRYPQLYFMVSSLYLPIFNEIFPSLIGRTIASSLHWETQGAFTGEVSAAMLADMRCYGAIIPALPPYNQPAHIKKTMELAKKHGLKLFSTFTLASRGTCDIIATDRKEEIALIPTYPAETLDVKKLPESGAILVNDEFLRRLPSGKEI